MEGFSHNVTAVLRQRQDINQLEIPRLGLVGSRGRIVPKRAILKHPVEIRKIDIDQHGSLDLQSVHQLMSLERIKEEIAVIVEYREQRNCQIAEEYYEEQEQTVHPRVAEHLVLLRIKRYLYDL
jgi:hypothetical protein